MNANERKAIAIHEITAYDHVYFTRFHLAFTQWFDNPLAHNLLSESKRLPSENGRG